MAGGSQMGSYPQSSGAEPPRTTSQKMNRFLLQTRIRIAKWLRGIRQSARTQILVVSLICFLAPGLFNTLTSMGASGGTDMERANQANLALYLTFTLTAPFTGIAFNHLGPAALMGSAGFTYALYSFYQSISDASFNWLTVMSGAIMGVGAASLWTSQGAIITTYPRDERRGTAIAVFWAIFNLGGVIGGMIVVILNSKNTHNSASDWTYYAIAGLMVVGSFMSFILVARSPREVIRNDNSRVPYNHSYKGIEGDFGELWQVVRMPQMIMLLLYFFSSNFFYTSRFNGIQGTFFNSRTRGLNTMLYWGMQSVTASMLGPLVLDLRRLTQRQRATGTLLVVSVLYNVSWASCLTLEIQEGASWRAVEYPKIDWSSPDYVYPTLVLLGCAVVDSAWQVYMYWLLGCFIPDIHTAAHIMGIYKCVQSAGAALAWGLDVSGVDNLVQIIIGWVLIDVAVPPAFIVALKYTRGAPLNPHDAADSLGYGSSRSDPGASSLELKGLSPPPALSTAV